MRISLAIALLSFAVAAACDSGESANDPDAASGGDAGAEAPDADPGDNLGELPAPVTQSGVAYVGQFGTNALNVYRTDGAAPVADGTMDVGDWVRDMALDPYHDLLVVVHEARLTMRIYQLGRPAGPGAAVPAPTMASEITFASEHFALAARFDPIRQRLYAVTTTPAPGDGSPVTEYRLHTFDVSNPASPQEIGSGQAFPTAISIDIDYGRGVLFAIDSRNDSLHAYDIAGDELLSLGAPLDLLDLFPEKDSNQFAFQARNVTVDMYRNRLYAARSQGVQSELIAIEYPPDVPRGAARYVDFASTLDFQVVADPFPVDDDPTSNPNLLDAYAPAVDQNTGDVFLVADAWSGSSSNAILVPIRADMGLATACQAFEGFGCWYLSDGDSGSNVRTDTAACVDAEHGVFVGASVNAADEASPGITHFFRYDDALAITPWEPADGGRLLTTSLPVAAVCH